MRTTRELIRWRFDRFQIIRLRVIVVVKPSAPAMTPAAGGVKFGAINDDDYQQCG
jgi:hypothetical protein